MNFKVNTVNNTPGNLIAIESDQNRSYLPFHTIHVCLLIRYCQLNCQQSPSYPLPEIHQQLLALNNYLNSL